jgi:hypothetical protein
VTTNNGQFADTSATEAPFVCGRCGQPATAYDGDGQPVCERHNPAVPSDPFDIEALRAAPPEGLAVEKVLISVPVRKPTKREFFRVHPGTDYVLDCFILEREQGFEKQSWWVAPGLREELMSELKLVRLFACLTRHNVPLLWPLRLPTPDGGGNPWAQSALKIAEVAKTTWVRMEASKVAGSYELHVAASNLGNPIWPDKTLRQLIEIAFAHRVIDSADHDVIKELNGAL